MGIADDILKRGNRAPRFQSPVPTDTAAEIAARPPTPFQPETTRQDTQDTARDSGYGRAHATPGDAALEDGDLIAGMDQAGLKRIIQLANDAPTGAEMAQISRPIFRKRQTLLTSVPLAANGVYTSPWFDSELTGTCYVNVTAVSNVQNAATTGMQLVESEDQVNVRAVFSNGAAATSRVFGFIRMRYWRIIFTNGATLQATFSLYVTESSLPIVGLGVTGNTLEPVGIATPTVAATVLADAIVNQNGAPIQTSAGNGVFQLQICYLFNGLTWDRPRTPAIFKQISSAATGSTALWTPAVGKKFRIMRYKIQVTARAAAAAAADLTIDLLDAAASVGQKCIVSIPATGLTAGEDYESGWIDLGNGILSALANNVLNLNLSFALTAGLVNVNVCGTEE